MSRGLYDEDGIDGPFERRMDAAIRDDSDARRRAARRRSERKPPAWLVDGATVNYHRVIGGPVTQPGLKVRGEPFQTPAGPMTPGMWVVFLEGVSGWVSCAALSQAEARL